MKIIDDNMNTEKTWDVCEECFWNYNCPFYGAMKEDEWTEELIEEWRNCKRYKE